MNVAATTFFHMKRINIDFFIILHLISICSFKDCLTIFLNKIVALEGNCLNVLKLLNYSYLFRFYDERKYAIIMESEKTNQHG